MGRSHCYSLMKCLLIIFNIIFLCVGVAACALAAWAAWEGGGAEEGAGRAALAALGAWGAALALGAACALAGAARASASLLAAAFALLALAAVAEAAAAWWGAHHLPQLRRALSDRLLRTVRVEYGRAPARTALVDAIQTGLQCCGAEGARDWQGSSWASDGVEGPLDLSVSAAASHYWVPASCCEAEDALECEGARRVAAASRGAPGLHAAPCAPRVLSALASAARAPLAAAAALLAAHALALLLALALCLRAPHTHQYKA